MRVLIIDNLASGLRNGIIHDFNRIFARDGDELTIRSTGGIRRIDTMLSDATEYDLVVASGGDSTISTVAYELRNTDIPLLPFPAGTANLLATNLNTPEEPSALARIARALKTEYYDLGEIAYECDGRNHTQGFAVIAGAGYDATIMQRAEKLKARFGPLAYLAAAASEPNPRVASFSLSLDEETLTSEGIAVLLINFAQIYPDLSITYNNDAQDGLFEVVVIKKQHTLELVPALLAALLDPHFTDRADYFESRRSARALIESDPPLGLQFDGETPAANTPFEAHILPGAARFVVV
ncbi:MAG: NAD(+)/NADH kinase [Coriobacteriales bacterium]|jgi:diacylglycerol kinase family enzyme|nr:NAD(+)/NADH kinase [Coriobacteriales bacterium]